MLLSLENIHSVWSSGSGAEENILYKCFGFGLRNGSKPWVCFGEMRLRFGFKLKFGLLKNSDSGSGAEENSQQVFGDRAQVQFQAQVRILHGKTLLGEEVRVRVRAGSQAGAGARARARAGVRVRAGLVMLPHRLSALPCVAS